MRWRPDCLPGPPPLSIRGEMLRISPPPPVLGQRLLEGGFALGGVFRPRPCREGGDRPFLLRCYAAGGRAVEAVCAGGAVPARGCEPRVAAAEEEARREDAGATV